MKCRRTDRLRSIVVSEDRNDWYYPAAPRPDAVAGLDEFDLDAASSTGNWGNKLTKGARWVRRGQMMAWAPGRTEWEASLVQLAVLYQVVITVFYN